MSRGPRPARKGVEEVEARPAGKTAKSGRRAEGDVRRTPTRGRPIEPAGSAPPRPAASRSGPRSCAPDVAARTADRALCYAGAMQLPAWPPLQRCRPETRARLEQAARPLHLAAGEALVVAGQPAERVVLPHSALALRTDSPEL